MASYVIRGSKHNVTYNYKSADTGDQKIHWESYITAREAIQRKAYIDYLQKNKLYDEVRRAALDYKDYRAAMLADKAAAKVIDRYKKETDDPPCPFDKSIDNTDKTYREFVEVWFPFQARKRRYSPTTYDNYSDVLNAHLLPYWGDRIMSNITAQEIDTFIDYLSYKPVQGIAYASTNPDEINTVSSSVVKKAYLVFMSGFPTAKKWGFVKEIPVTNSPKAKYSKRKAWTSKQVFHNLLHMEDKVLHLAVHLAFVCSLRSSEVLGLNIASIDLDDRSIWIKQVIQRASDQALNTLPKNEIIYIFPKQFPPAKSSLFLKAPKTEDSLRKVYITEPLCAEISERIAQIEKNKASHERNYFDFGLLICRADGFPMEPSKLNSAFKEWQTANLIEDRISFHGLRKSGQIHKLRLSKNNYQLVAEAAGHTSRVLMEHYNDIHEVEKRELSNLVEQSFYSQREIKPEQEIQILLSNAIKSAENDPALAKKLAQYIVSQI